MTRRAENARRQRGAALLGTLVLVALMAGLSVAMVEDVRMSVQRSGNQRLDAQTRWYALGAEEFARGLLAQQGRAGRSFAPADEQPRSFPIAGGVIIARLSDAGRCFNVNALVARQAGGAARPVEAEIEAFRRLADTLGLDRQISGQVVDGLIDWMDADSAPRPRGAEDFHYTSLDTPYLTGGTALAALSEMRAIAGVSVEVYTLLAPFLCALPQDRQPPLNVNSLRPRDWPLLRMALGEDVTEFTARAIIVDRPPGGYDSMEQVMAHPGLRDLELAAERRDRLVLESRFFRLRAEIRHEGRHMTIDSLFRRESGVGLTRLSRRIGAA